MKIMQCVIRVSYEKKHRDETGISNKTEAYVVQKKRHQMDGDKACSQQGTQTSAKTKPAVNKNNS